VCVVEGPKEDSTGCGRGRVVRKGKLCVGMVAVGVSSSLVSPHTPRCRAFWPPRDGK
jgi:hypothetical protein